MDDDTISTTSTEPFSPTHALEGMVTQEWLFGSTLMAYYHELQLCIYNRLKGKATPRIISALLSSADTRAEASTESSHPFACQCSFD